MKARRLALILVILVACIGLDQWTKQIAKEQLADGQVVRLLGDSIRLLLAKNYGTFLSLGASLPENVRNAATTIGVGVVLAVLFGYTLLTKTANPVIVASMSLLIGGGLSNLLDRIVYGGYVVDFLNVGIGSLRTGIFNVADMFIMLGVFLMLFSEQVHRRLTQQDAPGSH